MLSYLKELSKHHQRLWILTHILLFIALLVAIRAIQTQRKVTQKEYTAQVLDQYIRYYCPAVGTCSRTKALDRLRRDWPHVYQLGFQVLEDAEGNSEE